MIRLFRAVNPAELASLRRTVAFSNPPGIERKYFATTLAGARRYANGAEDAFDDRPYTIAGITVENTFITDDLRVSVDGGIETVVIPTNLLYKLTAPTFFKDE